MNELLPPLLAVELAILAGLFLLLLAWPVIVRVVESRRARQRGDLLSAVRKHRAGEAPGDAGEAGELEDALARCRPKVLLRALESMEEEGLEPDALGLDQLIRDTPAIRRVERAARSRLWWRRQTAAQVLGRLGRPSHDRSLLLSLLRDSHPAVRAAALLAARELGWPVLVEPLLDLAVESVGENRGQDALLRDTLIALEADLAAALLDRLDGAEGDPGELALMRIAGQLNDERLWPHLVDRLRHGGLEIRIQAAKMLAGSAGSGGADELRRALQDPAWQVRTQAARSLGELRASEAAEELHRALSDPSWWVRLRAALALRRLGRPGREILEDVDPDVDQYAADMADYVLGLEETALREYGR